MFTPLIDTLLHLSATFTLGLMLGFAIWKLGAKHQIDAARTEMEFWQKRLEQERITRDEAQEKAQSLEHKYSVLKRKIASRAG